MSDLRLLELQEQDAEDRTYWRQHIRMTTSSLNIKQFPMWVVNIRVQMLCFSYTAYPLPVIVRTICLFDNFEKLSMLLGFSRDILEGWARGCCMRVFLVL